MPIHPTGPLIIFAAKDAAATGLAHMVQGFDKLFLQLGTASSCNATVKIQGSWSKDKPDFSAAQTVANHWDYVDVIDLEDGASIDGDTGVAMAGTDDFRNFEVNAGGVRWLCATITARSAGTLTLNANGVQTN